MSLGVTLAELKNVQQIIDDGLQKDKTAKQIAIFTLENNKLQSIFATQKDKLVVSPEISQNIMETLYATKKDFWNLEINEQKSYVGITFKDALGIITGGMYLAYSPEDIKKDSQKEIHALYQRLLAFLLAILILSYIISYKTIKSIDYSLIEIGKYMDEFVDNPKDAPDPSQLPIQDVHLRREFIKSIKCSKNIFKSLDYIKRLSDEIK